jgi:hypothetical protein
MKVETLSGTISAGNPHFKSIQTIMIHLSLGHPLRPCLAKKHNKLESWSYLVWGKAHPLEKSLIARL